MSLSLGQTLAGLLNATFGNAVEIIVGISALLRGEVRIVQTSVSYPTRSPCNMHLPRARRCLALSYRIFFWFWAVPSLLVCGSRWYGHVHSLHRSHIAGIYNHESEFQVTAAQTSVFIFPLVVFSPADNTCSQERFGENSCYFC